MNRLYLDLESLPTANPDHIETIAAKVTPPANYKKADTIAEWEATTKPDLVKAEVAKTSFNGAYGSVCVIGWAWNDDEPSSMDARAYSEREMMEKFVAHVQDDMPRTEAFHQTKIIGHYVADFDLRFLWQRAFVLGVRMPAWWPRPAAPSWDKSIVDTMPMFAGRNQTISLDNLCKALGIDGKDDIDGSMVAGLWAAGEHDKVAAYCRDDVSRVRNAYKRMQIALGEVE